MAPCWPVRRSLMLAQVPGEVLLQPGGHGVQNFPDALCHHRRGRLLGPVVPRGRPLHGAAGRRGDAWPLHCASRHQAQHVKPRRHAGGVGAGQEQRKEPSLQGSQYKLYHVSHTAGPVLPDSHRERAAGPKPQLLPALDARHVRARGRQPGACVLLLPHVTVTVNRQEACAHMQVPAFLPRSACPSGVQGCPILLKPAVWVARRHVPHLRELRYMQCCQTLRCSVFVVQTPLVASNRMGTEKMSATDITFYGGSFIAGPTGEIKAQVQHSP